MNKENYSGMSAGIKVWEHFSIYLNRISWVCTDALRNFRLKIITVIFLSILGVAAAMAAFGGLFLILRSLQSGSPIGLIGIEFSPTGNEHILFIAIFLLGAASGGILYHAERIIADITTAYYKLCVSRLLVIASDPAYEGWQRLCQEEPQKMLINLSGNACRRTAMTMRRILQGILPLFTFVFAAGCMVFFDPLMTAAILPLGLIYLVPLYKLNKGMASQQLEFLRIKPEAKNILKTGIRSIIRTGLSYEQKSDRARQTLNADIFNETASIFFRRDLANDRAGALNTLFFFTCLLVLFFFVTIKGSQPDWSRLLIYLVAMRFTLGSMRNVTSMFITLSRLFPEYKAYTEFIDGAEQVRQPR